MRNVLHKAFRDRMRAGARPRRADPRFARAIVLTVPQAIALALAFMVAGAILELAGFALADCHSATGADIRLVAIVRSALPDADAASQDDIVARLSIPSPVAELLEPLVATDPARRTIVPDSWIDAFRGGPRAVTTPDRVRALGEIASAMAPLSDRDRTDQIANLVALYRATRDPGSRIIIAAVAALDPDTREILAGTGALQPILSTIAAMPDAERRVLASDPERRRLVLSIAAGDLSVAELNDLSAGLSDRPLRLALIYVIGQVRSGNPEIMDLLTAYWNQTQSRIAVPTLTKRTRRDR